MKTLYKTVNDCLLILLLVLVFPMMLNAQADTCQHEIYMMDDFGDGWNGCSLMVLVDGVIVLDSATIADTVATASAYFDAVHGAEITTIFTCGTWCYECSYEIVGPMGIILATDGAGGVVPEGIDAGECYADCLGTVTSIVEQDNVHIRLFPNPVKDKITIESSEEILLLSIQDCSGRLIMRNESINQYKLSISVSQYEPGIYFLAIDTEKSRAIRKIIVSE